VSDLAFAKYLFYAWLTLAVVLGVPAGIAYVRDRSLLRYPPKRRTLVPWNGFEVLVAFIVYFLWMVVLGVFSEKLFSRSDHRPLAPLVASLLSVPLILATILPLLSNASETKLYQTGLSWNRWQGSLMFAFVFWFFLTPPILVLNGAVDVVYLRWSGEEPTQHPLASMMVDNPSVLIWVLVILQAVVGGPLIEEFLFRGLLQRWLIATPRGGTPVLMAAACFALFPTHTIDRFWSFAFFMAMIFGYYLVNMFSRHNRFAAAPAIYAGSLLFAELHSTIWPTPVPLFFLGLALGYLACRTRSLVGPIVFHGLFNGVSCLALLWAQAAGEEMKGKPTTSADQRSLPASISSLVPNPW
jgi:membrane protease YdiL (CAAX protease family)